VPGEESGGAAHRRAAAPDAVFQGVPADEPCIKAEAAACDALRR